MALLDVSEVLDDPDFADALVCLRRTQVVSDGGMASVTSVSTPFLGIVTAAGGDILKRLAEGQRIVGNITVHSSLKLRDGGAGADADIVVWQGRNYTVSVVMDWSHFGAGFTAASCDLLPLSG